MTDDFIFNQLLYQLLDFTNKNQITWAQGKDNSNQYTCTMSDGLEILIDSYAVMNHSNINVSIFLYQKLVVERAICDTDKNLFDCADKLYKRISEVYADISYEDGIVLEVLHYLNKKL